MFELPQEAIFFSIISFIGLFFLLIGSFLAFYDGDVNLFGSDIDIDTNLDSPNSDFDFDDLTQLDVGDLVPSFFSLKVFRIILLCFGLGGNLGLYLGYSFFESCLLAILISVGAGYLVYRGYTFIYGNTIYNSDNPNMINREAKVILTVPKGGLGQIAVVVVGERFIFRAKALDNQPIPNNAKVKIIAKEKSIYIVQPILV